MGIEKTTEKTVRLDKIDRRSETMAEGMMQEF
jgi:hypothetical protein